MVKGFTDQEKEMIMTKLIEEGKQQFVAMGVKKTSIAQLTKAAGIAQGSFYQFFSSKEELFFNILELEEAQIKQKLLEKINVHHMTRQSFKEMLLYSIELIEEHQLVKTLFDREDFERIVRKLPQETMEEHIKRDEDVLEPLLKLWQQNGFLVKKDPKVITGAIRGFFTMLLHKKEIGEELFPEVVELLAESLAAGLVEGRSLS
ncbi:TetR/AcrR family transcriptional regulator [Ornithinibacillus xuwenensis]|uniref:TetR/AcrR family transcriptional regulator n=1 Tax=Ornithinibacillus xuwenensis TaxID=3144668 RepID=A0ABU9XI56_9BACI